MARTAKTFGQRPSDLLEIADPDAALEVDLAAYVRLQEKEPDAGALLLQVLNGLSEGGGLSEYAIR